MMFRYFAGSNRRVAEIEETGFVRWPVILRVFEFYPSKSDKYGDFYSSPSPIARCECRDYDEALSLLKNFGLKWKLCGSFDGAVSALSDFETTVLIRINGESLDWFQAFSRY